MTDNYFHTHKNQTMKLLTQYVIIPVSTIITSNLNVDIAARRGDYFFFIYFDERKNSQIRGIILGN